MLVHALALATLPLVKDPLTRPSTQPQPLMHQDGKVTVEEFVAYNIRVGQKLNDYEFKKQARSMPMPSPAAATHAA